MTRTMDTKLVIMILLVSLFYGVLSSRFYSNNFSKCFYWKKRTNRHEKLIYYTVGIGGAVILAAIWIFIFTNHIFPKNRMLLLLLLIAPVFIPFIVILIVDLILAGPRYLEQLRKDVKNGIKDGMEKKTYDKLFDHSSVILRLISYEDNWGHVSFRMNGIYAAEANDPEKLLESYKKPLQNEVQLKNVTDAFIRYIQGNSFDINQSDGSRYVDLMVMDEVHHDGQGPYLAFIAYGCGKDSIGPMVKGYGVSFLNHCFKDTRNEPITYRSIRGNGIFYGGNESETTETEKKNTFIPAIDSRNIAWQVCNESGKLYVYQGEKHPSSEPKYQITKSESDDNLWRIDDFRFPHDTAFSVMEFSDSWQVFPGVFTGRPSIYQVTKPGDSVGFVIEGRTIAGGNKRYIIRHEKYANVVYNLCNITENWK